MSENMNIRWGWLKFMYVLTILTAGISGLGIILAPEFIMSVFGWPFVEPIFWGIIGSVYLAFGILSIFGLRSPLKFAPVLLLQLFYKSIWFVGVVLPLLVAGQYPNYGIPMAILFATIIVGDLIAIPFRYLFAKQSAQ